MAAVAMTGAAMAAWIPRLRLYSGLVLFAYVLTHLLNHAFGLISLAAMQGAALVLFAPFWPHWPGTVLLGGALAVHMALALWSLISRRSWRGVRPAEYVQAGFGLLIPPLIAGHVIANRGLQEAFGLNDDYAWVLVSIWVQNPMDGLRQALAVVVAWTHGCIGLHFWLRLKPWYPRALPWLYPLAALVPVLSLLGFVSAGREVTALLADEAWREQFRAGLNLQPGAREWAAAATQATLAGLAALLAVVLLGRIVWSFAETRRSGLVTLSYPTNRSVQIRPLSMTVLEASRSAGIPHASVCGGRGRCSTCRVAVGEGAAALPEPSEEELKVLKRVKAPPGVRLACQIRPAADLAVMPLLPPSAGPRDAHPRPDYHQGMEREIAVLFADLRAFTRLAESKLPYDVVFLLNQYFRTTGQAVEGAGGHLDKFIGDGVMALFGLQGGADAAARAALTAARDMARGLAELNRALAHDLPQPLRMGIGIHVGPAIVGEMGYGRTVSITAIGDTVNTASRLEAATKDYGAELVVSRAVADRAGIDLSGHRSERLMVRGRTMALDVVVVQQAGDLALEAARV